MKGYAIDNTLYVFPQTAGAIPYVATGVTAIEVQQEDLTAWKQSNTGYASLMKPYNYNMMTVQKKVWTDHLNDDITAPAVDPDLAWSATGASVTIGADDNVYPTLTNTDNVDVVYGSSATGVATINASGTVTLVAAGDTTISAAFEGNDQYNAKTVSYDLEVQAAQELPEIGTVYNFTGYLTEDAEQPSSTGTITYEGEYSENTDYVYGTAEVTFVGSEQPQQLTVYMTKEDFATALDGGRAQVYTLESSEFVSLGYGELDTIEQ